MPQAKQKLTLLIFCTGNSCRSQMAEGWVRHLHSGSLLPFSAGIEARGLNPLAVQVMAEAGVDISTQASRTIAELIAAAPEAAEPDFVITVCGHAAETCPRFTGTACVLHHGFDDPPELACSLPDDKSVLSVYRRVRDEIRDFVSTLPNLLAQAANAQDPETITSDRKNK